MPDNPRMPGHPSDIPSSRSAEGNAGNAASGHPGSSGNMPPAPSSQNSSSGNTQTRNIIIGAIATIIASTTVYYLTQYVNNKKSDSAPTYEVKKEATINAWKRYVTIDNIYYKNIIELSTDKELLKNLDNYKAETFAETDNFIKDAEKLIKEKNIDKTLISMVDRRVTREKESRDRTASFYDKLNSIKASNLSDGEKLEKRTAESAAYLQYAKSLFQRSATEVEDLAKALTETYATTFNPYDVMIYADYKKIIQPAIDTEEADSTDNYAQNINRQSLIGDWNDNGNKISLQKNGNLSYSLISGDKADGKWKIEDNKLRVDAVSSVTKVKSTWYFNLSNLTGNSFTMKLSVSPFDIYHLTRVSGK